VGSEGESEFNVLSGGVLSGGTEVADELVELLEREIGVPQFIDGGVSFQGGVEGQVKARVGEEEG